MDTEQLLSRVAENLSVRRAFGAPYEKDGLLIIPVALVAGGGGGGEGITLPPRRLAGTGDRSKEPAADVARGSDGGRPARAEASAASACFAYLSGRGPAFAYDNTPTSNPPPRSHRRVAPPVQDSRPITPPWEDPSRRPDVVGVLPNGTCAQNIGPSRTVGSTDQTVITPTSAELGSLPYSPLMAHLPSSRTRERGLVVVSRAHQSPVPPPPETSSIGQPGRRHTRFSGAIERPSVGMRRGPVLRVTPDYCALAPLHRWISSVVQLVPRGRLSVQLLLGC
jgi:hypothetical protein